MSYYTAIRHASPRKMSSMYNPSREHQKSLRKASPKTLRRLTKEENTRRRYVTLHSVDKRAKRIANSYFRNRNINNVRKALNMYTSILNIARTQNWSNYDMRLISYFPYPRLLLRKLIYYIKQDLKRLESAKFLAGRKHAEMMMPRARAHFKSLA